MDKKVTGKRASIVLPSTTSSKQYMQLKKDFAECDFSCFPEVGKIDEMLVTIEKDIPFLIKQSSILKNTIIKT